MTLKKIFGDSQPPTPVTYIYFFLDREWLNNDFVMISIISYSKFLGASPRWGREHRIFWKNIVKFKLDGQISLLNLSNKLLTKYSKVLPIYPPKRTTGLHIMGIYRIIMNYELQTPTQDDPNAMVSNLFALYIHKVNSCWLNWLFCWIIEICKF